MFLCGPLILALSVAQSGGLARVPSIREHRAAPERKSELQNQAQRDLKISSANG